MKCRQASEEMFELAAGGSASPELDQHVRHCQACAARLAELRQTMALLDEWQAPEPSPYFDARLRARLREQPGRRSFAEWLREAVSPFTATGRKVALGVAMTLLVGVGVALFQGGTQAPAPKPANPPAAEVTAEKGSAVSDLLALDKNADLYASFDLLDDVNP